jgi:hypothetical protein
MEWIVHYELLERDLTVTAERYCQQLRRMEEEIQQNRPGRRHEVILHYDNSRPHTHCKHDKIGHLGTRLGDSSISVLLSGPCPVASPPLPFFLSNNLRGVSFNNDVELRNWLDEFFTAKAGISSNMRSKTWPNVGRQRR